MKQKKKSRQVLHIITRLDMGGSAQNTMHTCLGLSDKYEIGLAHGLSYESDMTEKEMAVVEGQIQSAISKGVRIFSLSSLVRKIDLIKDMQAFFKIFHLIRRESPKIVHTHSSKAGILGRWAAWMLKVPIIVHTAHGHVFYGHFNPILSKLFYIIERITALITDCMIALTEGERVDYLRTRLCREGKLRTIHSGVELNKFLDCGRNIHKKRKKFGLDLADPVIGTVGWLLPIKGPMILLKAMQILWETKPAAQLVYVGKGGMLEELESEVEQLGVSDKVHFLGWRNDIHEIIPIFDIFVLPSLNEGMGRVLVEAMATGRPIVASDTGGIPDLVKHGRNGLLVPPIDDKALSEAILWMLENPNEARQMGELGKEICKKYSLENMLDKIDRLYDKLLRENPIEDL